jgi:hypothetical protein
MTAWPSAVVSTASPVRSVVPGGRGQVLEQQGGDPAVVHVSGDRERDLGVAAGLLVVAAAAGYHTIGQRQQRHPARLASLAHPVCLTLGAEPAEVEETQVGTVR